ncbi:alpha/beta fold hydrolase [Comamonas antarctica]|uniref:Alpha/beta fold hydrolase n=1 Tax=Comamonas antarctica TaxID=2743470 RepID=A0A6N1X258_9BURK|nr:alpha/beta fold hydrolase [Comamonas antarctica]QKV52423.1 alpha/beta fold hydrolase [Comamonas antarctica]
MKLSKPMESRHFEGTAFQVHGAGEGAQIPIVLIHGVGMDQRAWQPQIAALAQHHRVVTYDMLGHGESRLPDEGVALADFAAQLLQLLDHLQIAQAHVVGHSMGALVALEFALRHPERCARLLALNAVFQRSPAQRAAVQERARLLQSAGVAATVDSTIERWFGAPVPAPLREIAALTMDILADVNAQGYARAYRLFATCDAVHASRLPQLAMPALFMTGEGDPNSSPAMSEALAALAPQGQAQTVPGARHMMNLTNAQEVNARLLRFIALPA